MGPRFIRFVYQRLGYRYLLLVLAAQYVMTSVVVAGGVLILSAYQTMSSRQFWLMMLLAQLVVVLDRALSLGPVKRFLKPLRRWFKGDHSRDSAVAAWKAMIGLPSDFLRHWGFYSPLFNVAPLALIGSQILDLSFGEGVILLAASGIIGFYGVVLRYFVTELALRPVLEDVAAVLPNDFDLGKPLLPLRRKLLIVIPVTTLLCGVLVASIIRSNYNTDLWDLGFDILIATAVSVTIAFEVSILLSRSIVTPIRQIRAATNEVTNGDIKVNVPLVTNDEAGQLAQSFNEMVSGLQERERLHDALETYVNPEVADRATERGAIREGDLVDVTVVFIDILNFTTIAERVGARSIVGYLNEFYEIVVPIITKYHGDPNKFIGDGLLAVFGAPNPVGNHADLAVKAAVELVGALKSNHEDKVRVGIGISSGPVLAGTIGGGGRLDYTVIGDTVNTASRVEELTRETGDTVLLTDATRLLLKEESAYRINHRLSTVLKGKSEPVKVYAVAPRRGW